MKSTPWTVRSSPLSSSGNAKLLTNGTASLTPRTPATVSASESGKLEPATAVMLSAARPPIASTASRNDASTAVFISRIATTRPTASPIASTLSAIRADADRTWRYAILSESALRIARAADRARYCSVSRTNLFSNESLPCTQPRTHAWVNSVQTPVLFRPIFGGTNDAGLEILDGGEFFVLNHDDVGGLARDSRARGRITIIDTSNENGPGAFQVNFEFGSGGLDIEHPAFSASVTVMELVGMTGDFTYVRRIGN